MKKKTQRSQGDSPSKRILNLPYGKRPRVSISFPKPTLTKQSFKDDCDINNIVNQFKNTGQTPHLNTKNPQYGFASSLDFSESMRLVKNAQSEFDGLPSEIRTKFNNDPGQFLDFAQDPDNQQEMAELGLIPPLENSPPEALSEPLVPPAKPAPQDTNSAEKNAE